jgi:serine/threonine protein phosphatase 1
VAESPPCDSAIFATLRRWRRVWAVAAIHGEAARLSRVLDGIAARLETGDRVVFLGNYLGYGPDVGGTLDRLIAFRRGFLALPDNFLGDIVFLRGWQEEVWHKLSQLQFSADPRPVFQWMLDRGMASSLAAYGFAPRHVETAMREGVMAVTRWTGGLRAAVDARPGHRALFTSLRHAARTDDGALLFVHAGYDPGKPLELQSDILWWGGADILALNEPNPDFSRIIRGFDRHHEGIKRGRFAVSIDGGAGFGGPLLAACFDRDGAIADQVSG